MRHALLLLLLVLCCCNLPHYERQPDNRSPGERREAYRAHCFQKAGNDMSDCEVYCPRCPDCWGCTCDPGSCVDACAKVYALQTQECKDKYPREGGK